MAIRPIREVAGANAANRLVGSIAVIRLRLTFTPVERWSAKKIESSLPASATRAA